MFIPPQTTQFRVKRKIAGFMTIALLSGIVLFQNCGKGFGVVSGLTNQISQSSLGSQVLQIPAQMTSIRFNPITTLHGSVLGYSSLLRQFILLNADTTNFSPVTIEANPAVVSILSYSILPTSNLLQITYWGADSASHSGIYNYQTGTLNPFLQAANCTYNNAYTFPIENRVILTSSCPIGSSRLSYVQEFDMNGHSLTAPVQTSVYTDFSGLGRLVGPDKISLGNWTQTINLLTGEIDSFLSSPITSSNGLPPLAGRHVYEYNWQNYEFYTQLAFYRADRNSVVYTDGNLEVHERMVSTNQDNLLLTSSSQLVGVDILTGSFFAKNANQTIFYAPNSPVFGITLPSFVVGAAVSDSHIGFVSNDFSSTSVPKLSIDLLDRFSPNLTTKCSSTQPQSSTPFIGGYFSYPLPSPYSEMPAFSFSNDCTNFYVIGAEPKPDFKTADFFLSRYDLSLGQIQILKTINLPYTGNLSAGTIYGIVAGDVYVNTFDTSSTSAIFRANAAGVARVSTQSYDYNLNLNWWSPAYGFTSIDSDSGSKIFAVSNTEGFAATLTFPQKLMTPSSLIMTTTSGSNFAIISRDSADDTPDSDAYMIQYYDSYGSAQKSEILQTSIKSTLTSLLPEAPGTNKFSHVSVLGTKNGVTLAGLIVVDPEGQTSKIFSNLSRILNSDIENYFMSSTGLPNGDFVTPIGACSYISQACGTNLLSGAPDFGSGSISYNFKVGDLFISSSTNTYRFHPDGSGSYILSATLAGAGWVFDEEGLYAYQLASSNQSSIRYNLATNQSSSIAGMAWMGFFTGGYTFPQSDPNGNALLPIYTNASGKTTDLNYGGALTSGAFQVVDDFANSRILLSSYNPTNQLITTLMLNTSTLKIENQNSSAGSYIGHGGSNYLLFGQFAQTGNLDFVDTGSGKVSTVDTLGLQNVACARRRFQDGTLCTGIQNNHVAIASFSKANMNLQIAGTYDPAQARIGIADIATHFSIYSVDHSYSSSGASGVLSAPSLSDPAWEVYTIPTTN